MTVGAGAAASNTGTNAVPWGGILRVCMYNRYEYRSLQVPSERRQGGGSLPFFLYTVKNKIMVKKMTPVSRVRGEGSEEHGSVRYR